MKGRYGRDGIGYEWIRRRGVVCIEGVDAIGEESVEEESLTCSSESEGSCGPQFL
jgi:hypothetical protein